MLANPANHRHPYRYFTAVPAFSPVVCACLEGLFAHDLPWRDHGGSFYEVRNCDVSERVDPHFLTALADRTRVLTVLPLTREVAVTAQIMAPGQRIGVHSDRPLVGYESVRLVVQLNRGWQPGDGGVLQVHDDEAGTRVCASQTPLFNSVFGFVMHPDSYHSVTETLKPRRTLVFNFWHGGNSRVLGAAVKTLFAHMQFAELPSLLDRFRSDAERSLPEEQTYRALVVATALQRWGLPEQVILDGYRATIGPHAAPPVDAASWLAVALAEWGAQLYIDGLDLARWQRLNCDLSSVRGSGPSPLATFREIAFPRLFARHGADRSSHHFDPDL